MPEGANVKAKGVSRMYEKVAHLAFYLMVGLVPITFLPFTVEQLAVNKQTLVVILAVVTLIAWLGMMIAQKKLLVKKSRIFIVLAIFLFFAAVSSALSLAPITSWIGQGKQEDTSFLTLVAYAILFVTGSYFLSETKVQRRVWTVSLISSALVGLVASLSFFGLDILGNNLIGSPNSLGLYLAAMTALGCGLHLVYKKEDERQVLPTGTLGVIVCVATAITAFSTLLVMVGLDYWVLWVALLTGLIITFTFAITRIKEFPKVNRFILPMAFFVVAILFLFLPSPLFKHFPSEVSPSYRASFDIAKDTLNDTSWVFGSGPGTFIIDYTKHRAAAINQTIFWDTAFDRSGSHLLTMLATFGIGGTLIFLMFILIIAARSLKMLITEKTHDEWKMTFVTFTAWSTLVVGMFLYSSNFTLSFMFWLLSAVLLSQMGPVVREMPFSKSPKYSLLTAFAFVVVAIGLLTTSFVAISRYSAEVTFAQVVKKNQAGASNSEVIAGLQKAVKLNRMSDVYWRNLSVALLMRSGEMLQDTSADPNEIKATIEAAIAAAQQATVISPNYAVNWGTLGDINREVALIYPNSDALSIQAYQRAVELAPTNPRYATSLGQAYVVRADLSDNLALTDDKTYANQMVAQRDEALSNAIETLLSAIALKADYAPAHYYLAGAYERQGNLPAATKRLETLANTYPMDVGLSFQLGLLYLKQNEFEQAKIELERALSLSPDYSNAMWFLASVYEEQGNRTKAIELLEQIKTLNPTNEMVDERLTKLRSGETSTNLPEPLETIESSTISPDITTETNIE